jgi:hypothetical protein
LHSVKIVINRLKSVEKRETHEMTNYKLGSKYIMIRCDYCNKKLAFIDGNRNAIHDIMCIDCSNLRHPQLAFQEEEEEQEDGK